MILKIFHRKIERFSPEFTKKWVNLKILIKCIKFQLDISENSDRNSLLCNFDFLE